MATITKPLSTIGLDDLTLGLTYLQGTIDAASVRIESGNEPAPEILYAQKYAVAGLQALVNISK